MMNIDIIIPSIKKFKEYKEISNIKSTRKSCGNIIFTGLRKSAAKNRNYGLDKSKAEIIIMIDDDITGFYYGWDIDLTKPLVEDKEIVMISSRLLNSDGTIGHMMLPKEKGPEYYDLSKDIIEIKRKRLLTACIAIRKNNLRYDEKFIGSGFEDDDYCKRLAIEYPYGKFLINNKCKIIHLNERKNQLDKYWRKNQKYFIKKWGKY